VATFRRPEAEQGGRALRRIKQGTTSLPLNLFKDGLGYLGLCPRYILQIVLKRIPSVRPKKSGRTPRSAPTEMLNHFERNIRDTTLGKFCLIGGIISKSATGAVSESRHGVIENSAVIFSY
jgi:hypothetical protein